MHEEDQLVEMESESERTPLIDHSLWAPLPRERDPLASHRPDPVDCPLAAWVPRHTGLEVQTGVCSYLAVVQPIRYALEPGDELQVDLWHELLDATEPGEGHVAVALDGRVLDEFTVQIPRSAAVEQLSAEIAVPVQAGAELVLHLHNHGFNSWTFVNIDRVR